MMKSIRMTAFYVLCTAWWMIAAVTQSFAQLELWETLPSPVGQGEGDLVTGMCVAGDGTVYGVTQFNYVVRSGDLGMSWDKFYIEARGFRIEAGPGGMLYAATEKGVYRSVDKGENWEVISTTPESPQFVQDVLVHSSGAIFAAMPGVGIIRSTDQGSAWEQVLFDADAQDLAEAPNGHLFAVGADSNGVYRSVDGGLTWTPAGFSDSYQLTVGVTETGTVLLATMQEGGTGRVYRSENEGGSWNSTTLSDIVSAFTSVPGAAYAAAANSGIWRSTDNGKTWVSANAGLADPRVLTVLYHPGGYLFTTNYFGEMFRRPAPKSTLGIDEREEPLRQSDRQLILTPNPASTDVTLASDFATGDMRVRLFDLAGTEVDESRFRSSTSQGRVMLNVEDLPTGLYLCRAETGQGTMTGRLIVIR